MTPARRRPRACTGGALAVVALTLLGGCRAATQGPSPARLPQATPSPAASPTPAPAPSCGDPKASLRPPPALPAPGAMPAGTFMRTIQDRGRLVVGVSQDTLLFGSVNPLNGQFEGFDIDVLHQLAAAILGDPEKIEFRAITSAERIPKILDGSVDIVGRTMTINCDRRQQVEFSTVYYAAGQRVLVRRDSKAAGIADVGGKRVCATNGSTSIDHIRQAASKPIAVGMADFTDCLVAFQRGEVDAISTDDAILAGLAAQDPYAVVVGDRFSDEPYGLAIRPDHPEFVRFVNGVLDRMRADGTWKAIYAKWLVPRLGTSTPEPPKATYKD